MTRLKWLIAILFVVAFAAGVLVGLGFAPGHHHHDPGSWLADELGLSPAQSEQMKAIWSTMVRGPGTGPSTAPATAPSNFDHRRQFQDDRDAAIIALLTPEQKAAYDKILARYHQQMDELDREREQAFQLAVEKSKAILTEPQRAKFDELLKKGFRRPWEHGSSRGSTTRRSGPMTQPSATAS